VDSGRVGGGMVMVMVMAGMERRSGGRKLISAAARELMSLALADRYPTMVNLLCGNLKWNTYVRFSDQIFRGKSGQQKTKN